MGFECIYNDKLKKGLCIGISDNTRTYHKDVVRMCWVTEKPEPSKKCRYSLQVQMTPAEAVGVGVALIGARVIGEAMLKNVEATRAKEGKHEEAKTKTP